MVTGAGSALPARFLSQRERRKPQPLPSFFLSPSWISPLSSRTASNSVPAQGGFLLTKGPTPVRAWPLPVLGREKAVEERPIALKSDAKVFSRDFVTAIPLALQPFSLFGE